MGVCLGREKDERDDEAFPKWMKYNGADEVDVNLPFNVQNKRSFWFKNSF